MYPGRVVTYDETTQLGTIAICAERVYSNIEGLEQIIKRAILQDVPCHTSSGGGWALTHPVQPGDTCLVMLSSIGYDHWLYNDKDTAGLVVGQPAPQLKRKFNENDGFAIVGLNTIPRAITGVSADSSQWRNIDSSQIISLNADGTIHITSPTTVTINADVIVNGDIDSTGTITGASVIGAGIVLETHTHSGDSGGTTSPPL